MHSTLVPPQVAGLIPYLAFYRVLLHCRLRWYLPLDSSAIKLFSVFHSVASKLSDQYTPVGKGALHVLTTCPWRSKSHIRRSTWSAARFFGQARREFDQKSSDIGYVII